MPVNIHYAVSMVIKFDILVGWHRRCDEVTKTGRVHHLRTTNATSKVHVTLTGTFKIKLNILLCANFVLIL